MKSDSDKSEAVTKPEAQGTLAATACSGAPPSIIYLQWDGDADKPNRELPQEKRGEITWCQDKIFKLDVEYIQRDELRSWLKNEILEDEGAMINARDHGEWDRYHRLDGHKGALVHVLHYLSAMRQNDKIRHDADSAVPQPKETSNEL